MNLNSIERFWNIVYYFAYRVECNATYALYKSIGIFKLYNLRSIKKRNRKIEDPSNWENVSGRLAVLLAMGAQMAVLLGLFMCFPNRRIPAGFFIASTIVILSLDYIFWWRKNKYEKYFKEFDKKPPAWKMKWAWISFSVLLLMYAFFFFSGLVLNPFFMHQEV